MKWIRNRCRHQRLGRRCCCRRSARRRIDHLAVGDGKPAELAIQAPLPNGHARALGTRRARVRVWASREERTAHQPPASRSSTISICAPAAKERYRLESCEPVEDHACCAIASLLVSCCTILGAMVITPGRTHTREPRPNVQKNARRAPVEVEFLLPNFYKIR